MGIGYGHTRGTRVRANSSDILVGGSRELSKMSVELSKTSVRFREAGAIIKRFIRGPGNSVLPLPP